MFKTDTNAHKSSLVKNKVQKIKLCVKFNHGEGRTKLLKKTREIGRRSRGKRNLNGDALLKGGFRRQFKIQ